MDGVREFEEDVRYVYDMLLNRREEGVLLTKNARLRGRSGTFHPVDVYYEFEKAGIRRKVAIECKGTNHLVDKARVSEFSARLKDIGNIMGLMVSLSGYESGTDTFAQEHGIDLLRPEDLPSVGDFLGRRLQAVVLPDAAAIGEPFWTIMEHRDGVMTGGYFAADHAGAPEPRIPLVYSKHHAEKLMKEASLDPKIWAVRGLPQYALRAFINMLEVLEARGQGAMLLFLPPAARADAGFIGMPILRQQLIDQYYSAPAPLVRKK
jgi:hypothetical protein